MNLNELETVLRAHCSAAQIHAFVGEAADLEYNFAALQQETGLKLPDLLSAYYDWLAGLAKTAGSLRDDGLLPAEQMLHFHRSLEGMANETQMWRQLQKKQPKREWRSGFLAMHSWNDCYQLVMDTGGEIGPAGCLLSWDFKGGSEYRLEAVDFSGFLRCKYELLKAELYFPPPPEHAAKREDFFYGRAFDQRQQIADHIYGGLRPAFPFFS